MESNTNNEGEEKMPSHEIHHLIQALSSAIGNKVYLRDLEQLLTDKLINLSPVEEETLHLLSRSIRELGDDCDRFERKAKQPWMP